MTVYNIGDLATSGSPKSNLFNDRSLTKELFTCGDSLKAAATYYLARGQ